MFVTQGDVQHVVLPRHCVERCSFLPSRVLARLFSSRNSCCASYLPVSVLRLIRELEGIQAFLQTQQGVKESVIRKLDGLSGLTVEECIQCSELIGQGPWTAEQAKELCLQVSPVQGQQKLRPKRENQECINFFLSHVPGPGEPV